MTGEQYKVQLDAHRRITNHDDLQYEQALNYYKKMKDVMLTGIVINTEKEFHKLSLAKISEIKQQIEQEMINIKIADSDLQKTGAIAKLDEVATNVLEYAFNGSFNGTLLRQEFDKVHTTMIQNAEYKGKKLPDPAVIINHVRLLTETGQSEMAQLQKLSSLSSLASGPVKNQLQAFAFRVLLDSVGAIDPHWIRENAYTQSLKGFYREDVVLEAYDDYSSKRPAIKFENIAAKNTPVDMGIVVQDIEKIFTGAGQGSVQTDPNIQPLLLEIQQAMQTAGNMFGAQIKSWQFDGGSPSDFLAIGYRGPLFNNSPSAENDISDIKWMAANMCYLGQRDNIITALGPVNVMMIAGNGQYWMDDFIDRFRKRQLYLSFDYDRSKKNFTPHVSLLSYKTNFYQKQFKKS